MSHVILRSTTNRTIVDYVLIEMWSKKFSLVGGRRLRLELLLLWCFLTMSWVSSLLTELIIPRGRNSPLGFHLSHYKPIFWLSGNWFNAQQTDIYVNVPQLRYRWNVKRIPVKWLLKIDCTVLWRLFYLMWDFRVNDGAENAILMEGWLQGLATFRLDLKISYEVTDGVFIIFPIEYKDN